MWLIINKMFGLKTQDEADAELQKLVVPFAAEIRLQELGHGRGHELKKAKAAFWAARRRACASGLRVHRRWNSYFGIEPWQHLEFDRLVEAGSTR